MESKIEDITQNKTIQIIFAGHRGYGATQVQKQRADPTEKFPENTLISLQKVMESGADCIEFDIYLSRDYSLMVIHDDALHINAKYILQEYDRNIPYGTKVGDSVNLIPKDNETGEPYLVSRYYKNDLKRLYDVSNGLMPDNIPAEERPKYTTIPELTEVLHLVMEENTRRERLQQPRVKLNIELKGANTGKYVQGIINKFNKQQAEDKQIQNDEISYISFRERELYRVASGYSFNDDGKDVRDDADEADGTDTPRPSKEPNADANLILGVPTKVQYTTVDDDYNIDLNMPDLNTTSLKSTFELLHNKLKALPERNENGKRLKGLTGVDMSMWDVSDKTIDYFCREMQVPIHVAVVPLETNELSHSCIKPALENISKIAIAQSAHLVDGIMIVKTDNPKLLKEIISMHQNRIVENNIVLNEHSNESKTNTIETANNNALMLYNKPSRAMENYNNDIARKKRKFQEAEELRRSNNNQEGIEFS